MSDYPKNDHELREMAEDHAGYLVGMAVEYDELERVTGRVADYLTENEIENVVIGVSGGLDSAVALAILIEVQKRQHLNIHAEVITFDAFDGVFKEWHVHRLMSAYPSANWSMYDLSGTYRVMESQMNRNKRPYSHLKFSPEVEANVTYAMRYQALFARAQAWGGITIGTTNKDELDFAGWFGKNSDMVTDLQFLWKFPKSVIRSFARKLGVPSSIIDRVPVGDLIDGTSDEENFGVTYNELRWYVDDGRSYKQLRGDDRDFEIADYMHQKFEKLEALHAKNAHKYDRKGRTDWNPVFI